MTSRGGSEEERSMRGVCVGGREEERSMRGVWVSVETQCNKRTIRDYHNRQGDLSTCKTALLILFKFTIEDTPHPPRCYTPIPAVV